MKTGRTSLTSIELAVVTGICRGYKPGQIQSALGIGQNHYTKIRNRILNKLGATNDGQIGMFAERQQLVGVDERNRIEDRREERLDARRLSAQ